MVVWPRNRERVGALPLSVLGLQAAIADGAEPTFDGQPMPAGTHLRWAFAPELGFPPGAFWLCRRSLRESKCGPVAPPVAVSRAIAGQRGADTGPHGLGSGVSFGGTGDAAAPGRCGRCCCCLALAEAEKAAERAVAAGRASREDTEAAACCDCCRCPGKRQPPVHRVDQSSAAVAAARARAAVARRRAAPAAVADGHRRRDRLEARHRRVGPARRVRLAGLGRAVHAPGDRAPTGRPGTPARSIPATHPDPVLADRDVLECGQRLGSPRPPQRA